MVLLLDRLLLINQKTVIVVMVMVVILLEIITLVLTLVLEQVLRCRRIHDKGRVN